MPIVTQEMIDRIIHKYPQKDSAALPIMQLIQAQNGEMLNREALRAVSKATNLSLNHIYGIATYYTMFNTKPVGKYHLQVDTCVPGFLHGADEIAAHLSQILRIAVGETTSDGLFTLSTVQDLASCATGPVIQVNDRYFENMTIAKVDQLVDALRKGHTPENDPSMTVYSECGILLNDRTQPDCRTLAFYKKNGGYRSLAKAKSMQPKDVINEVKEAPGRSGPSCQRMTRGRYTSSVTRTRASRAHSKIVRSWNSIRISSSREWPSAPMPSTRQKRSSTFAASLRGSLKSLKRPSRKPERMGNSIMSTSLCIAARARMCVEKRQHRSSRWRESAATQDPNRHSRPIPGYTDALQ